LNKIKIRLNNKTENFVAVKTDLKTIVIKPSRGWAALNLKDLWIYRELVYFMTWRDLKVRYKQTLLGASWAVLQPFLTMVVFSIFFGGLAQVPSDNVPYPIFSFTALLPLTLFTKALLDASKSLVSSSHIITKIYFPRIILPLASILAGIVDFFIAFVVLIGMMVFYKIAPTVNIWTLPFFLILTLVTALGVGLWLSALNVQYRDVRYTVPFLVTAWMYASPIAYSATLVPEKWRALYGLNPMVGVVEGFRWMLLDKPFPDTSMFIVSTAAMLVLFFSGLIYFKRMENYFADVI
jgi:lipopolysaccharide transport system permease protein